MKVVISPSIHSFIDKPLKDNKFQNKDRIQGIFFMFALIVKGRAEEWFSYITEIPTPLFSNIGSKLRLKGVTSFISSMPLGF